MMQIPVVVVSSIYIAGRCPNSRGPFKRLQMLRTIITAVSEASPCVATKVSAVSVGSFGISFVFVGSASRKAYQI